MPNRILFLFIYLLTQVSLSDILLQPLNMLVLEITLLDTHLRVWANEAPNLVFYFWWTNFWYIFIFIFLFWSYSLVSSRISTVFLYIYFSVFYFSVFYFSVFYFSNTSSWLNISLNYLLNDLLYNAFNKIHPMLFYLSVFLIVVFSVSSYKQKIFQLAPTPVLIFSLLLGSWWAAQEGSWGGWWNWDISEIFGIVFLIVLIYPLHTSKTSHSKFFTKYEKLQLLLLLYLCYLLTQLNFISSSHNFGLIQSGAFIFTSSISLLTVLVIVLKSCTFKSFLLQSYKFQLVNSLDTVLITNHFLGKIPKSLSIFLIVYLSYTVVFINFKFLEILFIPILVSLSFKKLLSQLILLIMVNLRVSPTWTLSLISLPLLFTQPLLLLLLYPLLTLTRFNNSFHFIIFFCFLVSFAFINETTTIFFEIPYLNHIGVVEFFISLGYQNYTLDTTYFFTWLGAQNQIWFGDFIYNFTSALSKLFSTKFTLPFSVDLLYEILIKISLKTKIIIAFIEHSTGAIFLILFTALGLLSLYFRNNLKIKN